MEASIWPPSTPALVRPSGCRVTGSRTMRRSRGLQPKARDAAAQVDRHAVQLVDRLTGLTERVDRLLRRFAQLGERLGDLLRAARLRRHSVIHGFDARGERLHLQ